MKRLLVVAVLMLCLSFPAFAGHTLPNEWCECGGPITGCICDPGEQPAVHGNRVVRIQPKQDAPVGLGSETLLVLALLLLALRYKA
jgi:hypothetical protein